MNTDLQRTIAEALGVGVDSITPETGMSNEPRWDSLRHMQVIFALEDVFGVRFRDDEIAKLTSVAAIVAALAERGKTG